MGWRLIKVSDNEKIFLIKGDENSETVYEYSLRQNESVKAGEFKKNSKNILKNSSVE